MESKKKQKVKEPQIVAPAGGMILVLDADELEAMKTYIGFLIEDKLNKSAWTLEHNIASDPSIIAKRIPIYKQILDKVGYVPKPKNPQNFQKPQTNKYQDEEGDYGAY